LQAPHALEMNEIFSWNSGIIIKVIENTHAAIGYQIFHVGRGTINRFYWCFHGSEPTHKHKLALLCGDQLIDLLLVMLL
jgi:hypothetical protein